MSWRPFFVELEIAFFYAAIIWLVVTYICIIIVPNDRSYMKEESRFFHDLIAAYFQKVHRIENMMQSCSRATQEIHFVRNYYTHYSKVIRSKVAVEL